MKVFATALLLMIVARHFTAFWLGAHTYLGPKGWSYMMTGIVEVFFCGALAYIVYYARKTKWRWLALFALGIGISEGLQIAACRIAIVDISLVPAGTNLCDYATGLPITLTMNSLYLLILSVIAGGLLRDAGQNADS